LRIGRFDVVRNQLERLMCNIGESGKAEGVIPRSLDNRDVAWRTGLGAILQVRQSIEEPLRAEWLDQHHNIAIDGNALVIIAVKAYVRATANPQLWNDNREQLRRVLRFYDAPGRRGFRGLIIQPEYSDWQDSLKRDRETFYTNLLYATALEAVVDDTFFGVTPDQIRAFRHTINEVFFDRGTCLYRSLRDISTTCLDDNLLAIELGHAQDPIGLYRALSQHPLWIDDAGPGFVSLDTYDTAAEAPQFWFNLRDYHTQLYWSWLMALAARIASRMGDDLAASRILAELLRMARRDGAIAEVYQHTPSHPMVHRLGYTSEAPFSWGSAMVVETVSEVMMGQTRCPRETGLNATAAKGDRLPEQVGDCGGRDS
jgi:glycogen debranching enzyme